MTLEEVAFMLLALGILSAHLATLRLLSACKRDLAENATSFSGIISDVNDSMMEVVRIGSDVADQIDTIALGSGVASVASVSPPVDIQSSIMSLIANQFLGGSNGNQTQQERSIYQENDSPPESLSE